MRFGILRGDADRAGKMRTATIDLGKILHQIEHADPVGFDGLFLIDIISFRNSISANPLAIFAKRLSATGAHSLSAVAT